MTHVLVLGAYGQIARVATDPAGVAERPGRSQLRDNAEGSAIPECFRDRVAKERGRPGGQAGHDTGS
jgi:hypothetical protein